MFVWTEGGVEYGPGVRNGVITPISGVITYNPTYNCSRGPLCKLHKSFAPLILIKDPLLKVKHA